MALMNILSNIWVYVIVIRMGGDLGGTVPPKFEVGGRPMHSSPNILEKYSVKGSAEMYEVTEKRWDEEIFGCETEVFL